MSPQQDGFAERLRRLRESAGYSQEALAERAGLSANAISALERGERKRPYPDTIRRLAEALGLSDVERSTLASAAARTRGTGPSEPSRDEMAAMPATIDVPGEPTPLIGREHEIEVVRHLIEHTEGRLLTLTGPGGVGKTRLALHVARGMGERYPNGVVWVELAPVADPGFVIPTIARALGLEEALGGDSKELLRSHLKGRRTLLVLDNLEHLLDAAIDIAELLRSCPTIGMLVTSRARLNIRGEQEYVVPPLELPPAGQVRVTNDVANIPSVQLFVWLIRQKDPSFELTQENAALVAQICRRVDGVPLALELAAPKARVHGMQGLLTRLDRALPVLTGGPRDLPARQRTMEGAIRWSYDLLDPAGQVLFRRLSVFSGGWTLDAAEAVVSLADNLVGDVFDGLATLVDQSLVRHSEGDDFSPRFSMLVTLREFGAERLAESSEGEAVRLAHLRWCIDLAETAEKGLAGPQQTRWLHRLETEHDNIRAALGSGPVEDSEARLRLAGALWRFWWWRGHFTEGRAWLRQLLDVGEPRVSQWRGKALNAAGILAREQGDFDYATAVLRESLSIRRELGDRRGAAQTLNILGLVAGSQDDFTGASERFEEALVLYRGLDDKLGIANVLNNFGSAIRDQGEFQRAAVLYAESMELYRAFGEKRGLAVVLHNLGRVTRDLGDRDRALELFEECLAIEHELGDRLNIGMTLNNMGRLAQDRGDIVRAVALFEESLNIRVEFGDKLGCVKVVEDVAAMAATFGQAECAVQLYSAAGAKREVLGAPMPRADRDHHERFLARARKDLDAVSLAGAITSGHAMTVEDAVNKAFVVLRQAPEN